MTDSVSENTTVLSHNNDISADKTIDKKAVRHPEKAHRPDNIVTMRKPDWIRVKAPQSQIYKDTKNIVKDNKNYIIII